MKNVLTIVKKEFARFFKDRRMIITILLPGILIYVLYSIMGSAMADIGTVDKDYKFSAYFVSVPDSIKSELEAVFEFKEEENLETAKSKVAEGNLDLVVVFPQGFENVLNGTTDSDVPNVSIYYNGANDLSAAGYSLLSTILDSKNKPSFTVNSGSEIYNLASESDFTVSILSMLVPMLMFALLASACMAVAPEAIAGEKERGTMATMLITPIGRGQLALGKIISLTCFALISGISSFLGVLLSLPKLTAGFIGAEAVALYGIGEYLLLFCLIISIVLVIISAFSVLSTLAKSVKEAGMLITPLMMVIILLGLVAMFISGEPAIGLFAIPLVGSGLAISSIMSLTANGLAVALAVISNVIIAAALVVLLSFMFKSEKIMFNK